MESNLCSCVHGFCSDQGCLCPLAWTGVECEKPLVAVSSAQALRWIFFLLWLLVGIGCASWSYVRLIVQQRSVPPTTTRVHLVAFALLASIVCLRLVWLAIDPLGLVGQFERVSERSDRLLGALHLPFVLITSCLGLLCVATQVRHIVHSDSSLSSHVLVEPLSFVARLILAISLPACFLVVVGFSLVGKPSVTSAVVGGSVACVSLAWLCCAAFTAILPTAVLTHTLRREQVARTVPTHRPLLASLLTQVALGGLGACALIVVLAARASTGLVLGATAAHEILLYTFFVASMITLTDCGRTCEHDDAHTSTVTRPELKTCSHSSVAVSNDHEPPSSGFDLDLLDFSRRRSSGSSVSSSPRTPRSRSSQVTSPPPYARRPRGTAANRELLFRHSLVLSPPSTDSVLSVVPRTIDNENNDDKTEEEEEEGDGRSQSEPQARRLPPPRLATRLALRPEHHTCTLSSTRTLSPSPPPLLPSSFPPQRRLSLPEVSRVESIAWSHHSQMNDSAQRRLVDSFDLDNLSSLTPPGRFRGGGSGTTSGDFASFVHDSGLTPSSAFSRGSGTYECLVVWEDTSSPPRAPTFASEMFASESRLGRPNE